MQTAVSIPTPITILNTPVHPVTMSQTLLLVQQFMSEPQLHQLCTTNPEFVMTAQNDPDFRQLLQQADLCLPDGIGLVLASRWQGQPLPERVAGSDLIYRLAKLAAEQRWRLFLLGAAEGVANETAVILQNLYPTLQIVGTHAGSPAPSENETLVEMISTSQADLLMVAYGAPKQDKWIARNRNRLPTVRVALGVGGAFDFVTGRTARAPRLMQQLGLEWLHRLIQEPWRWRRMLVLPKFVLQIILKAD